jgi:hypothetical protein
MTGLQRLVQLGINAAKGIGTLVAASALDVFENAKACAAQAYEAAKAVLPGVSDQLQQLADSAQAGAAAGQGVELLLGVVAAGLVNQLVGWLGAKLPVWKTTQG